MAHILIMPRQGNTVESCIITNWKVKEGDTVTPETPVCEVETDKAAFEVPAGAAGTVLKLLHASGDDVPVLTPIAVIGELGENWEAAAGTIPPESQRGSAEAQRETPEAAAILNTVTTVSPNPAPQSEIAISPRARNLAEKEALPLPVPGTGPGGRIIERDVIAALRERPLLTVAAKAAGAGTVPAVGSGIGGQVTAADLASPLSAPQTPDPRPQTLLSPEGAITETPIKGIRKIIAERMFKSLAESAQFTLNSSASAVKLQEIRSRIKTEKDFAEEHGLSKISINDLILFAVSRTLPHFSFMNAHKIGDTIKTFERVHLAVAVDTPRGLMVPVIRNANLLSLAQISSEAKRLAAACQNGSANPDELSGSTFTVTNLGSMGITNFTPVLNAPEVAILGVCGIELKPVALPEAELTECGCGCDCGVCFEPHIGFSLTINHQAVDGAPAAEFLKALGEAVAHIDLLLAAG
jgi:pyruvate dehydrogenase E2 component (dihydrolipoamide acetyltransferase)